MSALAADSDADREAGWIRRIARGDRSAFDALFAAYHRRVFHYLLKLVGSPERAEELADDVLFEVWKGAGTFRAQSKPSTWIFGIAHHRAASELRRARRPAAESGELEAVPDPRGGPDRESEREELRGKVRRALDALSREHREVVELTFYDGLSYGEIAEVAAVPVGTVKTRMFHARRRLQEVLARLGVRMEEVA